MGGCWKNEWIMLLFKYTKHGCLQQPAEWLRLSCIWFRLCLSHYHSFIHSFIHAFFKFFFIFLIPKLSVLFLKPYSKTHLLAKLWNWAIPTLILLQFGLLPTTPSFQTKVTWNIYIIIVLWVATYRELSNHIFCEHFFFLWKQTSMLINYLWYLFDIQLCDGMTL